MKKLPYHHAELNDPQSFANKQDKVNNDAAIIASYKSISYDRGYYVVVNTKTN